MDFGKITAEVSFWAIIVAIVILIIPAVIVRDYHYMVEHPIYFAIETLAMGILPAFPVLVFYITRGTNLKHTLVTFAILVVKFAILHILIQLAGVYTYIFSHFA